MSMSSNPEQCPFCNLSTDFWVGDSEHAIAFHDRYPISPLHTLVIPRRHVGSMFDLCDEERADLWQLVARVRHELTLSEGVDGFNIGVNDGPAAGQTVMHAHVHVIPRRKGDVLDPRGGIRWVIPKKACYW